MLDLGKEPQVLIVNFGSVTDTPPGNYVIAGPGQYNVSIPAGTHVSMSTTTGYG